MSDDPNAMPLAGDLSLQVVCETDSMEWQRSPNGEVLRKRLHRVGPPESGQVTSLVRYPAGARFPSHSHPEGEEILVLEGVFSDEHGDWGKGSYLLNPEGFRHAPFSEEGCLIFVKLRQYAGAERVHVALDTEAAEWRPSAEAGIEMKNLYRDPRFPDAMQLERWSAGAESARTFPEGGELWTIAGSYRDEQGIHGARSWRRLPPGREWKATSDEGCTFYLKTGGVSSLRTA